MKKLVRMSLGLIGFGVLALVFTPMSEQRATASNPQSVIVTNTPLPVQGTVSVGNTPSVNVANSPSVTVANTAVPIRGNVQVFNPLDSSNNPVPLVVNTPGQPYSDNCHGGGNPDAKCSLATLPSGMRLVLQSISFDTSFALGENVTEAVLVTTVNGSANQPLFISLSDQGVDTFGNPHKGATISTPVYADAGSTPECGASASAGGVSVRCAIFGYLVPAQ